ncbi:MAG TPA: pantoate kinase [Candidatus Methanoculleus thermohydrogenotrophicum]|jgi:pantoate kinase|nr:pantoate kinase [Candidatus Methanoculleus thermohydrogenotrophicum]NLM82119.1 GHMP kinase [Candidatus Methanoculleus thermohydrogenotrophicum]HOB18353.1 pantoate kinase [Candidatus Methanoculleus thermohydrogenotrophicum]HPZ37840.1 pantoate kinase [Candidatus Methanoculleus thermohydrogenotrophicum]HQC91066.1 pantoate kinase [Candidatus Methanoculleus thermohydrogenotrophicum]
MVQTAVAFSPGHISGYFKRVEGSGPESTGSVGAGVVIDEGVRSTVTPAAATSIRVIWLGRVAGGSPPVEYALDRLGVTARVTTECQLPIGAGFGLSAAALLATLTAANHLFDLGLSADDVAAKAHEAEVVHRTGLGDVAASQGGGVVCRMGPGIHADITRFYPDEPLYAVSLGPLPTASVLSSPRAMARIAAAYPDRCPRDLVDFCLLSREFAKGSGLIAPEVRRVLAACDAAGIPASMTMLGNGVFACGGDAERVLSGFGEVYCLNVARRGAHLIEMIP